MENLMLYLEVDGEWLCQALHHNRLRLGWSWCGLFQWGKMWFTNKRKKIHTKCMTVCLGMYSMSLDHIFYIRLY